MLLLASLSLLPLALTSPLLLHRSCPTPTSFAINNFGLFTAAANQNGFSPTYGSSIGFGFSDPTTGIMANCDREVAPGAGSVADPNNYYNCTNPAVQFKYDGETIFINEMFSCNGVLETASANFSKPGDCFPEEPPTPSGYGTECVIPGHTSGEDLTVTSVTVDG